jgi:hypothetical protein
MKRASVRAVPGMRGLTGRASPCEADALAAVKRLRLWLREPSKYVRSCPEPSSESEALAIATLARASPWALSAMTWRDTLIAVENRTAVFRKSLLYPSELRGHPATP